jgi:hypothetical protein
MGFLALYFFLNHFTIYELPRIVSKSYNMRVAAVRTKAENPCFLPSIQLLTAQQFQKDPPTKNEIKTSNQQIKQPNK